MDIQDMAVRPTSDPCWQFPVGLHGNRRETKLFATRFVKQALKSGDFVAEIARCERRSVLEDSDTIYAVEESRIAASTDVMWRVKSVWTAIEHVLKDSKMEQQVLTKFGRTQQELPVICDQIAFETFNELWHAISFLDCSMVVPCYWASPEGRKIWATRALETLVEWLPEMWLLSQRIFSTGPPGVVFHFGRHPWACTVPVAAKISGYHVSEDHLAGKGDPVELLIQDRIIRVSSTRRFELVPLSPKDEFLQEKETNGS